MLAAALSYAQLGLRVFPIKNNEKRPLTKHGFKEASCDEHQIRDWWSKWPNANIGMPTGAVSRLMVLDLDPRNGGPRDRSEVTERFGEYGETPEQLTELGKPLVRPVRLEQV